MSAPAPHERALASLRNQCKELYRQMERDADPVETLFTFAKGLIDENSYIIGWNDGWEERVPSKRAPQEAAKAGERDVLEEAEEALRIIAALSVGEEGESNEALFRIIDANRECAGNALNAIASIRAREVQP